MSRAGAVWLRRAYLRDRVRASEGYVRWYALELRAAERTGDDPARWRAGLAHCRRELAVYRTALRRVARPRFRWPWTRNERRGLPP